MYKITLYDQNCSPICDGTASFFTEDLNHFEQYWRPHANENQLKRYDQSKAGKIVADYYGNDPELNIVQIDSDVKIFFEKEVVFHNKMFTLLNAYAWESKIYAAKTTIIFRGIRFLGKYFLIGKYKMEGVCEKSFFSAEDKFQTIHVWGNPVVICNLEEKPVWYRTKAGRESYIYQKEDFAKDSLETYCWVTVGEYSKEKLLSGTINLESDETMVYLMRDIPGEAG